MVDDLLDGRRFAGGGLSRCLAAVGIAGLLCVVMGTGQEGVAQVHSEPAAPSVGAERVEPRSAHTPEGSSPQTPRRTTPGDLPSWAEPRTESSGSYGGFSRDERQGKRRARDRAQTDNPGTPGDGNRVPLGGLEWLLAAGAGYGFWKLREEE